ncbi:MAG: phage tail protein [Gammaproteobacteria bacterium]|nr:phage tail protein [Gammaproteobacteria bacterium]
MADKLVEITFDQKKLNQLMLTLRGYPKALPKIVTRGINKTATAVRTQIVRGIAENINLKIGDIRKKIILKKASYLRWLAEIFVSGRRIPLISFGARQTKSGVSYRIDKSTGRKKLAHAFIATMSTGHSGVFKRRGKARLPIDERFGPSLGAAYEGAQSLVGSVTRQADENLSKNIYVQLEIFLDKYVRDQVA